MRYRPLGNSGIIVSEIGFGGWGIGGETPGPTSYGPTDDNESQRALAMAFDLGVNFFDTADVYGHSEELIGKTFKDKRERVVIATKVGFLEHHLPQDFSNKNLVTTLEKSLKIMGTGYIDLYQLHNPNLATLPINEIIDTLLSIKKWGLVRALGISVKSPDEGLKALEFDVFDSIQTNLSMIDQRAIDNGLLERAKEKGVGIIARTPLNFGFLTDKGRTMSLDFGPQDHRSVWPMKQREAWQKAAKLMSEIHPVYPLVLLALRYCLSVNGVNTVIPGMLTVNEVLVNTAAGAIQSLSREAMDRVRRIYNDNDQFFIRPS